MVLVVEGRDLADPPTAPNQLYRRYPALLTHAQQLALKNPRRCVSQDRKNGILRGPSSSLNSS